MAGKARAAGAAKARPAKRAATSSTAAISPAAVVDGAGGTAGAGSPPDTTPARPSSKKATQPPATEPSQKAAQPARTSGGWSPPSVPQAVDSSAGFVLALLAWTWIGMPFLKGGLPEVKKVLKAKFLNRTPDGRWLP